MTRDAAMLLALVCVAALWLVIHGRLLTRALRSSSLSLAWRLLAIVPLITPLAGWRAGARGLAVLWVVHALAYGLLRSLG